MADLQGQEAPIVEAPKVEAPSAEQPEIAQPDTATEAKPQGEEDDKKSRRHISAIQSRINELTREKHEANRRAEAAEAQAREYHSHLQRTQGQANRPTLDQFKTYDEYTSATAKYEAALIVAEKLDEFSRANLQTFQQRDQQERQVQAQQHFDRSLQAVEKDGLAKYKDFQEVVSTAPNYGPQMGQMVLATEHPADISYYLAKNPEHGIAIASMPPLLAMREIGKIEAQFSKRVTSAPKPPTTVGQANKGSTGLSDDLSADEWYKRRQAQLNRKP